MSAKEESAYVPRKWYASRYHLYLSSATGRLITAKDHASVQLSIAEVDASTGLYTGRSIPFAFSGYVRNMSESDDCMNRLCTEQGLLKNVWSAQK